LSGVTAEVRRRRRGRPAGVSVTREKILTNARELFARNGIDKTSIRAVAAAADVDPALVHHYYGTKEQLFAAAIDLPIDPEEVLAPLWETPAEQLGDALVRLVLPLWDSPVGSGFIATIRSLMGDSAVNLPRSYLQEVITVRIASRVDNPPGSGKIRAQYVASQLIGVVMARYILALDPFKSLSVDQIAETIGPTLQCYLTGPPPGLPSR